MIITKKCLPRRSFLRGAGALVALPLLDAMVPALTALAGSAAARIRRLGIVYVPNGIIMEKWTPAEEGKGFALTPMLQPLAPYRDRLLVVSGLDDGAGIPLPGEGGGDHARAAATFLTGVHAKKTEGPDIRAGISIDQIAAQTLGMQTQLASLELAIETNELVGACDAGYSCVYVNTLSWHDATTPLPMENDPRRVFERLFGDSDSTDPARRIRLSHEDRSVLDSVANEAADLRRTLGADDRAKLAQYLDAIRDTERRIQRVEQQNSRELPLVDRPASTPAVFEEHAKLMFDLQLLAFQCDLTRVITFMMAREVSGRSYPEIEVRDPHHALSHHRGDPAKVAKVERINLHHMNVFAYYLERLQATADGDGSLLDHTLLMYASGMSNGDMHVHTNLPIVLVGGRDQVAGGRHLRYPAGTPVTNLYLTLLDTVGVPVERFGDSTGKLELLSGM
jgi:hypothetical protein